MQEQSALPRTTNNEDGLALPQIIKRALDAGLANGKLTPEQHRQNRRWLKANSATAGKGA